MNAKAEIKDAADNSADPRTAIQQKTSISFQEIGGDRDFINPTWSLYKRNSESSLHDSISRALIPGGTAPENPIEKPPPEGLRYIYLIDADDDRRTNVHRLLSGQSNMVVRAYRSHVAFVLEANMLDEGCVLLCDKDNKGEQDIPAFIRSLGFYQRFVCVVLATEQDIRTAIEVMKAGAADCLLYPCDAQEILSCVSDALDSVRHAVAHNAALIEARRQIDRLTAREQDVLYGLMHGKSNKMIALDLDISPRTVEIYRAHLMEKLGAHSLSETLKVAFAAGLG